jgi:serine/threonine protein kinase
MTTLHSDRSDLFSVPRSTLLLPDDSQNAQIASGLSLRHSRTIKRSTLMLPHDIQNLKESSLIKSNEDLSGYDEITLLQYIIEAKVGRKIKITPPTALHYWPISGRGRIFTVKRFPTGGGGEMAWDNLEAPAVAVKCLASSTHSEPGELSLRYRCLLQELRILLHEPIRQHFNFAQLDELGWEPDPLTPDSFLPYICTEYARYGTLHSLLTAVHAEYLWKQRFILDIAEGISALHQCGIVHSDIKTDNVLIIPAEDANFPLVAKISDFGFSVMESSKVVGCTPLWAPPEVLRSDANQSTAACSMDIYSLGFVIWSVAIDGRNPFEILNFESVGSMAETWMSWKDSNELVSFAVASLHSDDIYPDTDVEEMCNLLCTTLQSDPADRDIDIVLACLRGQCKRTSKNEISETLKYEPLEPFDFNKVILQMSLFSLADCAIDSTYQHVAPGWMDSTASSTPISGSP